MISSLVSKKVNKCLVYKDNDRRDLGICRPILILPIFTKVFEKEVFNQLYRYITDNSTMSEFQDFTLFTRLSEL